MLSVSPFDRQPVDGSSTYVPPGSGSLSDYLSGGSDLSNQNVLSAFNNFFTGNRDYNRQQALMSAEQAFNAEEAEKARAFSAEEARKQRDWQEMQSRNAYSYYIQDLRRNGINPYAMLSSGVKVPTGSAASASSASVGSHGAPTSAASAFGSFVSQIVGSTISAYSQSSIAKERNETSIVTSLINALARKK